MDKALAQYESDRIAGLPDYVPVSESYDVLTEKPRAARHESGVTNDGVYSHHRENSEFVFVFIFIYLYLYLCIYGIELDDNWYNFGMGYV